MNAIRPTHAPTSGPAGEDRARLTAAMAAIRGQLGADAVLDGEALEPYRDPYGFAEADAEVRPGGVVRPGSVDEVQSVLRVANAVGQPLWTVSRGRNFGYGGAAPRLHDSLVVDLSRMDRVLEVDDVSGAAMLEPGVSFMQLHEHLCAGGVRKLWPSVPDIGWGSVIGNTLERGFGYTPYGDHSGLQCGLEVVLADGEVVRTGMGAKAGATSWPLYKGGYGPSFDGLFLQSNLGVVTKMGLWMMPAPEQVAVCHLTVPDREQLGPLIDALRPMLLDGSIQSNVIVGNAPVIASMMSDRATWWARETPIDDDGVRSMMEGLRVGYWNARFALYGPAEMVAVRLELVRRGLAGLAGADLRVNTYAGDVDPAAVIPPDRAQLGIPSIDLVRMANWRGGEPAHTDFSLVCAPTGEETTRYLGAIREEVERHGFDYAGGFTLFPRHAIALALVSFDRSDQAQRRAVSALFPALIRRTSAMGSAPYRSHTAFMDLIAEQYDFGGGAARRLAETLKDALDPAGVLSPGKQGVWPAAQRPLRA